MIPASTTINAVVSRLRLHPESKIIYVEGKFDHLLIKACFRTAKGRSIFSADYLHIDSSDVLGRNLLVGTKGRLLAAAQMAHEAGIVDQLWCVVDTDGGVDGMDMSCPLVVQTGLACSEMLGFTVETIQKFLVAVGANGDVAEELVSSLSSVLILLHQARKISVVNGLQCSRLKLGQYVKRSGAVLEFDFNSYLRDFALESIDPMKAATLLKVSCDTGPASVQHAQMIGNGHDLLELLQIYLQSINGVLPVFRNQKAIERIYLGCISPEFVRQTNYGKKLAAILER